MNANFLKNGNKVHIYMNTIRKRPSFSNSLGATITRPYFQCSKASYSRFAQTNSKQMEFSWISNSRIMIGWYLDMLKTRPILTKTVTWALIYTAADLSYQTLITRSYSEGYDHIRTLRMAGFGMIILGTSMHLWFNFVSRLFPNRDLISTFKKMVTRKTILAPAMSVVFFFTVNAVLQGQELWLPVLDHPQVLTSIIVVLKIRGLCVTIGALNRCADFGTVTSLLSFLTLHLPLPILTWLRKMNKSSFLRRFLVSILNLLVSVINFSVEQRFVDFDSVIALLILIITKGSCCYQSLSKHFRCRSKT